MRRIVEGIHTVGKRVCAQNGLILVGKHQKIFHLALTYLLRRGVLDAALLDTHVDHVGHIIRQCQVTLRLYRQQNNRQQNGQRELFQALENFFHFSCAPLPCKDCLLSGFALLPAAGSGFGNTSGNAPYAAAPIRSAAPVRRHGIPLRRFASAGAAASAGRARPHSRSAPRSAGYAPSTA